MKHLIHYVRTTNNQRYKDGTYIRTVASICQHDANPNAENMICVRKHDLCCNTTYLSQQQNICTVCILKHIKSEHLDKTLQKELKLITELFYIDLFFTAVFYPKHPVTRVSDTHSLSLVSVFTAVNAGTDGTLINITTMARIQDKSTIFLPKKKNEIICIFVEYNGGINNSHTRNQRLRNSYAQTIQTVYLVKKTVGCNVCKTKTSYS